jgi:excisionase family DNA binding protein
MKPCDPQFGMRKNPDSLRVHGLRFAADPLPTEELSGQHKAQSETHQSMTGQHVAGTFKLPLMDGMNRATGGMRRESARLLTVEDVASLLHVPVSWIYGRMRKRSLGRLPGYRLGKYWRFHEDEVLTWVKSQRRDPHAR